MIFYKYFKIDHSKFNSQESNPFSCQSRLVVFQIYHSMEIIRNLIAFTIPLKSHFLYNLFFKLSFVSFFEDPTQSFSDNQNSIF